MSDQLAERVAARHLEAAVLPLEARIRAAIGSFGDDCMRHLLKWAPIYAGNWGLYAENTHTPKGDVLIQGGPGGINQLGVNGIDGDESTIHVRISLRPDSDGLYVLINVINQTTNKAQDLTRTFESGHVKTVVKWAAKQIESGLDRVAKPLGH